MTTRRRPMQVSIEAIVQAAGQTEAYESAIRNNESFALKVTNAPYMPLTIEVTGEGNVSVAHYFTQNGDAMRDPEIVFNPKNWYGVEITQDPVGVYQRVRPNCYSRGIEDLARIWAKNLREQGFIEAAARQKVEPSQADHRQPAQAAAPVATPKRKDKRQINALLAELDGFARQMLSGEGGLPNDEESMKAMRAICRKYMVAKQQRVTA